MVLNRFAIRLLPFNERRDAPAALTAKGPRLSTHAAGFSLRQTQTDSAVKNDMVDMVFMVLSCSVPQLMLKTALLRATATSMITMQGLAITLPVSSVAKEATAPTSEREVYL